MSIFLTDESLRRLEELRSARDPQRLFASYLVSSRDRLNVHE